jgi:hypothetical protein
VAIYEAGYPQSKPVIAALGWAAGHDELLEVRLYDKLAYRKQSYRRKVDRPSTTAEL